MADAPVEPIYRTDALIAEDIEAYLDRHQTKTLLRFITCGSVDDGKSTLIGRLLYDSKMIFEDQLAALEADSKRVGTQGQEIDFALLVDGLAAEREQGITIDVAYRFFATEKRKFIVADTPGHEQYTRNMVTGASTADLAVILIDARKGVLTQTRRHSYLAHLIGIRHLVLAVNKMDLVGYDKATFDAIVADYGAFAASIGIDDFVAMPISGFKGDNITSLSPNTPWYAGPTLVEHLETVEVDNVAEQARPFRMPVQWVNRPNLDFRGFSGLIASGTVKPGDAVRVLPSGKTSTVGRIVASGGDLDQAVAGQSVTLTLADEIDCSRGDVIAIADNPPQTSDQFEATLVWLNDDALHVGRAYWLKLGTRTVSATVTEPKYKVNVNTLEHLAAKQRKRQRAATCENPDLPEGVRAISLAALEHARASLSAFRRYASRAGMAAARYQSIYALQRAQRSRECMAEASLLHGEIAHSEYTHLRGWLAIQQASCTGQGGEIERSREYSREALKIAKGAALDSLALRALNALVSAENEAAHHEGVWNSGREALAIFWSGYHPPSRALNLYMDLMFWGEETANWHTAVSIGREAAWAAQQMHDPLGEAITRHRLARAEYMARNVARSSAELLQANRLFDSLESTPADRVYRMDSEIDLAALEAERGEAAAARRRLEAVRGDLAHTQSYVMPLHFYRALGHVEVLEGRLEQAEASLRQAIGIAEKARSSLANETERHIWGRESGKAARALVRVKLRQGRQLDALAEWEQVQSSWRAGRASTMEIREGLAGAQPSSRIAYAVYEDGIQIWWSRRGVAGWQSHWVDLPRERLRRAAQRFYDACSNPRSDLAALRRDAQELYRWLVEPAAAVLEDEQLYIVTDRELALIPFAALVDAQGRWLAEKTAVVFAMNLRSAEMNAGALPKDWSKLHALIVAPSVPAGLASEFPPLPDAVAEAEMVAGYFPRHTLLVGREATLENVLRALPSAEIFHFAGHAPPS